MKHQGLFVCFLYSKFLPAHVISTKCFDCGIYFPLEKLEDPQTFSENLNATYRTSMAT